LRNILLFDILAQYPPALGRAGARAREYKKCGMGLKICSVGGVTTWLPDDEREYSWGNDVDDQYEREQSEEDKDHKDDDDNNNNNRYEEDDDKLPSE
jgi:hypothetical protein